jgi:hypothetical protein
LKNKYGVSANDVSLIKSIGQQWTDESDLKEAQYQYATLTKGMHSHASLKADDWFQQADLDCQTLKNRIAFCTKIWSTVGKMFKESLEKAGIASNDVLFATPKQ